MKETQTEDSTPLQVMQTGLIAAGLLALPFACNQKLAVRRYTIQSKKIQRPLRAALLTDLHSCYYGRKQSTLLNAIALQNPHIVLLGGDIAEDRRPHRNTLFLMQALGKSYPTYYVPGNHELKSGEYPWLKKTFTSYGVRVMQGERLPLSVNGQLIQLCGVEDPFIGRQKFLRQIDNCLDGMDPDTFSLLLTHRPEYARWYARCGFDLVLAGHAHGGVWRIPGLINGFLASSQGFFPKYAGGEYTLGKTTMLVSRGLARESTPVPRIFNRPELVIADIVPAQP